MTTTTSLDNVIEHATETTKAANERVREFAQIGVRKAAEGFELPGADLSGEELSVRVLPRQADEFTCSRCFLVHHRSQLAYEKDGQLVCTECA